MKIYTTLNIGEFHTNHCEDFLISEQIASDRQLVAVLDGCTMGTESVFASMLYGKILRKIARDFFYQEFATKGSMELKDTLKAVTKELMAETRRTKNQLGLETNELLSTLIVGIIDSKKNQAELLAVGDGLICKDGEIIEYEQDDKPDYLGYHLSEDFETWYQQQEQRLSISGFADLSICTDGIYTFKNFGNKGSQLTEREIFNYLLLDNEGAEFDGFLERKVRTLKENMHHVVTDDLAVIRIKK